jgi:hypothetical protein
MFIAHVELTSDAILLGIDSSNLSGYEDVEDYMQVSYVDQYSSSVIFTDEGFMNLEFGPFAGTQFEIRGDRRVLNSVADGFLLISAEDQGNGGFDITYCVFSTFEVMVHAKSEEEAKLICLRDLGSIVQLVEGSTDEVYEFVDLSVVNVYLDE